MRTEPQVAMEPRDTLGRVRTFLAKPFHEQSKSVYARWKKIFPNLPFPVRLPFGVWLIGRYDYLGATLTDAFEPAECAFMQRFLRPGMTVLDIGANQGFYTLLASSIAGKDGKVFAFEPSPRERDALSLNLRLNFCGNVSVQPFALGNAEKSAELYVVKGFNTGFNSLSPPKTKEQTSTT